MLIAATVVALFLPSFAGVPHVELRALVEDGHFKRARTVVAQQSSSYSNDSAFLALAAQVKLAFEDLEGAAKLAEQAAELDPKNPDRQFLLCEIYGTQAQRASIFRQPFLGRKTKKAMDQAVALDPRHVDSLFVLMLYYEMAPGLIGGDKTKARAMPARIREIDPARGWLADARLAELEKRSDDVERFYRRAVEANPKHFQARMALAGLWLNSKKDYRGAAAQAQAAQEIAPGRAQPYAVLAAAYAGLGQVDQMENWLRFAERAVPDNLYPHLAAARMLARQGRELERAQALMRRYLEMEPEAGFPNHAEVRNELVKVRSSR